MTPDRDIPFTLFGLQHTTTILIVAAAAIGLPFLARRFGGTGTRRAIGVSLGTFLVLQEVLTTVALVYWYDVPLAASLPLHLCGIETFLVAYVLLFRSYPAFEVAYFWGVAGTLQAILTPDLQQGFPSLTYVSFFAGHGAVIVGVSFAIIVYGFRPTLHSVRKAVLVTLAYLVFVGLLNLALGTNFFYLRHKPNQPSLMDYFGPWPWYILVGIVVGIAVYLLCYLPFAVAARRKTRRNNEPLATP